MIAAEVMVPCISFSPACRLDWAAISALGGWLAAAVTFFAVLLPFRQYRRELRAREDAERTDAEIAARGSVLALSSIHTGLEALREVLKAPRGFEDFTDSFELIRRFIFSVPAPVLPRSQRLRGVRVSIASLDATLANLKGYVTANDQGHFDAESVKQYVITIDLACGWFNKVIAGLDAEFPDFKFGKVLSRLDEGSS
ncbi:hypothetical protein [Stenotrophomonas sp.]|uniref:hypothetical protein n=1 Tax=Stenotrophomonas sp. TaxID=69392 RepID=UPI0028A8F6AF|nr:hypothetical protein [Stenotrophomonas sp.]